MPKRDENPDDPAGFAEKSARFVHEDESDQGDSNEFTDEALENLLRSETDEHDERSPKQRVHAVEARVKTARPRISHSFVDSHDFVDDPDTYNDDSFLATHSLDDTFGAEEARKASGNYIITFGYPGSGKSTFHSMLFRYIEHSGRYDFNLRPAAGQTAPTDAMIRRLQEWRNRWTRRTFVDPTPALEREIYEIAYSVRPLSGVTKQLDFSIIEVSGELLQNVDGLSTDADIALPSALHELIGNESVNPILVIMVDPDTPANDLMFASLMDYIGRHFPNRLRQIPICALIPKPDKALNRLKTRSSGERFKGQKSFTRESRSIFLREFAPGVLSHLTKLTDSKRLLAPLSIGTIAIREREEDGEIREEKFLVQPNFSDIHDIFSWLYQKYTGKKLGKTSLQKLFSELSRPVNGR